MPLLEPSWLGLTITGNASPTPRSTPRRSCGGDQQAARGVDAGPPDQELGQPLVEGERVRVGVGAGVRDAELLEQRRVQRLAQAAALALGGVEDDVGVDGLEALEQGRLAGPETSTFSTSWPAASIAAAIAFTVSTLSNSASFSECRTSVRRRL
jgi:hypothetical protein